MIVFSLTLALLACLLTLCVAYLLFFAGVYFFVPDPQVPRAPPTKRFSVLIPAHNEELIIATSLQSWLKVDYPKEMYRLHVIADNCTDRTIEIAQALGATVWDRQDYENRGKGQALAWALQTIDLEQTEAVVMVDADTTVDPAYLRIMNDRLVMGGRVIQGYDGVMNPYESAMTCLMQVTNVMKNLLFNCAKSKIGLSVQLMGTGMCFERNVLKKIGWKAFSIGEDGEQFAHFAKAGTQVEFEPRARVFAQEASSFGQAYTQRVRWSAGRMQLIGLGVRLLVDGARQRNVHLVDAALTFLLPNYAMLANLTIGSLVLIWVVDFPWRAMLAIWFGALLLGQILYLLLGVLLAKPTGKVLSSLAFAPVFLVWKVIVDLVSIAHVRQSTWVRTKREPSTIDPLPPTKLPSCRRK
jgi:cellulose synthase/poly-beta-1,6-N-acetylglucosamine synthase-like glycosyltransferase